MRSFLLRISAVTRSISTAVLLLLRCSSAEQGFGLLQRRQSGQAINLAIENLGNFYQVNIAVGTPPQKQILELEFSKGNTWVIAANRSFVAATKYDAGRSSTATTLADAFHARSFTETNVSGVWISDDISLNGLAVKDVQMGVVYNADRQILNGTLGLGSNFTTIIPQGYNLLHRLYNNSQINCACYSLWLNDATSSRGRLILGGVDTSKFQGSLATLPLSSNTSNSYATVSLAGVQTSNGNINTQVANGALQVLPDPSTTLIYLPKGITQQIYEQLGVSVYDAVLSLYLFDCHPSSTSVSVGFTFAITNMTSTTISVPLSELVIPHNETLCIFGIQPASSDNRYILGISFFRNAYVIYDYSHALMSVAPANFYSITDNVTTMGSAGVVSSISRGTGPLSKIAANATNSTAGRSGLTTASTAGVGVGVSLGGLLILIGIGFLIFRYRRHHQQAVSTVAVAQDAYYEKAELGADEIEHLRYELKTDHDNRHELYVPWSVTPLDPYELASERPDRPLIRYELSTG